jgi:hypothetical protein
MTAGDGGYLLTVTPSEEEGDSQTAYLQLPGHPKVVVPGIVKRTIRLSDVISGFKGPDVYLDFDEDGVLIGMEFLE